MRTHLIMAAVAAVLVAGCGDDDDAASRQMSAPAVSAPETTASPASGSDAPSDATGNSMQGQTGAVPEASDVLEPAHPANTAQETTANPPNELTKQEESENMPQPGAVHSYSTPVREQTDQTSGK